MKRRSWLWVASAVLIIIFLGSYLCLRYTQWPLKAYLSYQIKRSIPFFELRNLSLSKHHLTESNDFIINQLRLDGAWQAQEIRIDISRITVFDVTRLLKKGESINIVTENIRLKATDLTADDGQVRIVYTPLHEDKWELKGSASFPRLSYASRELKELRFQFEADPARCHVNRVHAHLDNGQLAGEFMLDYQKDLIYHMDISFDDLNTNVLSGNTSGLNQQIKGFMDGTISIKGRNNRITAFKARVHAPSGARVNAKLLQFLTDYIPQSTQKKRLGELIQNEDDVFFDRFMLDIKNEEDRRLQSAFDLKSQEFNLDMKLTVDINVDGGLTDLIQTALTFTSKEK